MRWLASAICLACVGIAVPLSSPAATYDMADADPLIISVNAGIEHDSNVFRLPDSTDATAILGDSKRSDRIVTTGVGLTFDKTYSRQRIALDAAITRYRYERFGYLDFDPYGYRAYWRGEMGPRLIAVAVVERQQRLANYADYLNFLNKNIVTTERRRFDAEWSTAAGWSPIGSVSQLRRRYSQVFRAEDSYDQTVAELGLKSVSASGNSLAITGSRSRGEYLERTLDPTNLLDTGFDQHEIGLDLAWRLAAKASVEARLAKVARTHDHFGERDYSGIDGSFDLTWNPTAKVAVTANAARTLVSYQTATTSYYVDESFYVGPVWAVSAKSEIRVVIGSERRQFFGSTIEGSPDRTDHLHNYELSAAWNASRHVALNASIRRSERSSTLGQSLQFTDNLVKLALRIAF
jgi:exopolysaccharide biosynthesis operon protein EpsL